VEDNQQIYDASVLEVAGKLTAELVRQQYEITRTSLSIDKIGIMFKELHDELLDQLGYDQVNDED